MSDPRYDEPDPVRWFDALGACVCGKPAHGKLMGPRNESYGRYCAPCAKKRLAAAERSRARWALAKADAEMSDTAGACGASRGER